MRCCDHADRDLARRIQPGSNLWQRRREPRHRYLSHLPGATDLAVSPALSRCIVAGPTGFAWSLILVYPTFTIPFCTWLFMGFFKSVPREIEEAAIVDGCTVVGAFVKTILPLSLPGILTVIIFAFTLTMQEFVYAL